MSYRLTILGCGSSGGVPRLSETPGGEWGDCDPANPRNRRRRCALLVERTGAGGTTRLLIDATPDLREQLLSANVGRLDAVLVTHAHADHVHGIDDLRMIVFNMRTRLRVLAHPETAEALRARFGYAFAAPEGSAYPPICDLQEIAGEVRVDGPGGRIEAATFPVEHGGMPTWGLRVGAAAYVPDASDLTSEAWAALGGLDLLIVDALRRRPHPTHANLDTALAWIERAGPRRAVLTNMHVDMDYAAVDADTPAHVVPAHDGLVLDVPA